MKKLLFVFSLLICSCAAIAQTDPAVKEILDQVSKKYDSYKTMRSDFTLEVKDAQGQSYTNTGIMLFNKAKGQYRIQIQHDDIISDGESVWSISKELKEIQVTEAENNPSSIGPHNLFTFYKTGYKYLNMPNEHIVKNGKRETARVIELSPEDNNTNYFKIKLRINNNDHIQDITIFDKANNRYVYAIQSMYVNQDIPARHFSFNKNNYPGYEIVDLR